MTTGVPADALSGAVPAPANAPSRRAPGWIWRHRDLIATPMIIIIGLGLVLLYTARQRLDSVEQRALDPSYLWAKLVEHIWLTAASAVLVIAIALPLGIVLSRPPLRRIRTGTLAFGGFMQALPPYGVIILLAFLLGFGTTTAIIALVVGSFLPVLTNTVVGLRQVDPALIEAARGMGMPAWQILLRVELPLAVPVMVAGIRVALVLNVGTATLATFIGAGGLGDPISSMLDLGRPRAVFVASAIVAALALLIDWLAGVAERLVSGRTR
jgi:ABC-type proline/glycine betaine transport system permease subunit